MGGIPQGAAPDWSHCERLAMTDALNEQLSALLDGELPDGESELVLKSRCVGPQRLLDAGFLVEFRNWPAAAEDLVRRWRGRE